MDLVLYPGNRANKRRRGPNNAVVNGTYAEIVWGDELRKRHVLRSSLKTIGNESEIE